jgi:hypothetical protein
MGKKKTSKYRVTLTISVTDARQLKKTAEVQAQTEGFSQASWRMCRRDDHDKIISDLKMLHDPGVSMNAGFEIDDCVVEAHG